MKRRLRKSAKIGLSIVIILIILLISMFLLFSKSNKNKDKSESVKKIDLISKISDKLKDYDIDTSFYHNPRSKGFL